MLGFIVETAKDDKNYKNTNVALQLLDVAELSYHILLERLL